jgi:carbon storage regulator CsrA
MLALARGEGQSIIIDGRIEVKIVKWSRSSVRLAIQAPREVAVDRDEIWRKVHPGELTPLEKAEIERRERFAREGGGPGGAGGVGGAGAAAHPEGTPPAHPHDHPAGQPAAPVAINAPIAGVFYGSAGPGGNPYVSPGSAVEDGSLVGSIKNGQSVHDVRSTLRGAVLQVLAATGQHVAQGQPLVLIKPGE